MYVCLLRGSCTLGSEPANAPWQVALHAQYLNPDGTDYTSWRQEQRHKLSPDMAGYKLIGSSDYNACACVPCELVPFRPEYTLKRVG